MTSKVVIALLLLLIAAHGVAVVEWLDLDNTLPRGEAARAFVQSHRVIDALAEPGSGLPGKIYQTHPEPQPPLVAVAAALCSAAFPDSLDAPVYAQIAFLALAAFGSFAAGRRLRGPWCGLLAAFLLTTTTHVAIYEHVLTTELALLAFSACALASYLYSDGYRKAIPSALLGLCLGSGMLSGWNFAFAVVPFALAAMGAIVYWALLRTSGAGGGAESRDLSVTRVVNALATFAIASAIAFPWWRCRGADAWTYTNGPHLRFAVSEAGYYAGAFLRETSAIFVIIFIVATGVALLSWAARGGTRAIASIENGRGALFCVFTIAVTFAGLTLDSAKDYRYAGLLLAPAAVFAAWAIRGIRFAILRFPAIGASCALSALAFFGVSFDVLASDDLRLRDTNVWHAGKFDFRVYQPENAPPPLQPAPGRSVVALARVKNPPDVRDPDPLRALDAIARDRTDRNVYVYFVTPQETLPGIAFEYLCESRYPRFTGFSVREYFVGPTRDRWFAAFSPYEYLIAQYVVVAKRRGGGFEWEKATYPMNAGFAQFLSGEPPVFRKHFRRIYQYEPVRDPFERANDLIVDVYKRTATADIAEINELTAGIQRFDRMKPGTFVDLAYYWFHAGRVIDARRILELNVPDPSVLAPVHRDRLQQIAAGNAK
jgi:hypothetical protein